MGYIVTYCNETVMLQCIKVQYYLTNLVFHEGFEMQDAECTAVAR